MKVIFLDNDGVICLSNNWGSRGKKRSKFLTLNPDFSKEISKLPVEYRFDNFDSKAIKILNEILTETGAEIIVSSDWKLHATLEELGEYYLSQGILKKPVAVTPKIQDFDEYAASMLRWKGWLEKARILEIEKYLELNHQITHWVAIDDLDMSPEANQNKGLENFVHTKKVSEGIKQSGIKQKVMKFLAD